MTETAKLIPICGQCGAELPHAANFCPACGTSTAAPAAGEQSLAGAAKEFATDTANEIKNAGREALKSDLGKKMAAGAALGAVAAAAIPFVTWGAGALIGGGLVLYKRLTK